MKTAAANATKKYGKTIDAEAELGPWLRRLANNKFFDIDREEALHPGYRRELGEIAALRGESLAGNDPVYKLGYAIGRYGVLLGFLAFVISRWTRRVSRKTAVATNSRAHYYLKLLFKMSWRVAIIIALSFIAVVLLTTAPSKSQNELFGALAVTSGLFVVFFPPTVLLTSWWQTKRKFSEQPQSLLGNVQKADRQQAQARIPPSTILAPEDRSKSPLASNMRDAETAGAASNPDARRQRNDGSQGSTWWKRLFTVLEISVLLLSAILVAVVFREISPFTLSLILIVPVLVVRFLRTAIVYVVEGQSPFGHHSPR